jgi:hypothetical protein
MTGKYQTETLARIAEIKTTPNVRQSIDRTFELPSRLYFGTVGAYLAFLAIMAIGFRSREMVLPMAIFVIYIMMAFGVPALWTRMRPAHHSQALDVSKFAQHGIETWTGQITARDATLQVLILPVLILFWGVVVVTIAFLS